MSSIESSANSSGCGESDMHANMKNQWVMDDFGGALYECRHMPVAQGLALSTGTFTADYSIPF
jgi:hypothetical protein